MNRKIQILIFSLTALFACSTENGLSQKELTYTDFESKLKLDMKYTSIVSKFGKPLDDRGSGIHIYVYKLTDSTEMWIGYDDSIVYARHVDADHNLITILLERK